MKSSPSFPRPVPDAALESGEHPSGSRPVLQALHSNLSQRAIARPLPIPQPVPVPRPLPFSQQVPFSQPLPGSQPGQSGPVSALRPREALLEDARQVLLGQSAALAAISRTLDHTFVDAVKLVQSRRGRLVVCGLGKSGLVGRKIAATLSSTGTPSFFLHATEALHGDLGMVTEEDTVLMLSHSGKTKEILSIVPALQEMGVPVIALCSGGDLARMADLTLHVAIDREACPLNLAPTTSTLVTLALGDALAMALSTARGFAARDFAKRHPGGELGRKLCTRVHHVMRQSPLPVVSPDATMSEALMVMTQGRAGIAIVEARGQLLGVITDGDLRRALQDHPDLLTLKARQVMTTRPVTISQDATLEEAEGVMEQHRIKALLAVDHLGRVSGIVEFFSK